MTNFATLAGNNAEGEDENATIPLNYPLAKIESWSRNFRAAAILDRRIISRLNFNSLTPTRDKILFCSFIILSFGNDPK